MSFSWTRVRAIAVKELRDCRTGPLHRRHDVGAAAAFHHPPLIQLFHTYAHLHSGNLDLRVGAPILYMLVIPAFLPSTLSASRWSASAGREIGTCIEIPIRRKEFRIAKALAALVPTLVIAYLLFSIFLAAWPSLPTR